MKFPRFAFLTLALALFSLSATPSFATAPSEATAAAQKARALKLFGQDAQAQAAVKTLLDAGYVQVSTDAVPYAFVYGDEGAITHFLVTAWLGKSEQYGWSPAFVTAKVNTDSFGAPPAVSLIDEKDLKTFLDSTGRR